MGNLLGGKGADGFDVDVMLGRELPYPRRFGSISDDPYSGFGGDTNGCADEAIDGLEVGQARDGHEWPIGVGSDGTEAVGVNSHGKENTAWFEFLCPRSGGGEKLVAQCWGYERQEVAPTAEDLGESVAKWAVHSVEQVNPSGVADNPEGSSM